MLSYRHAFHAGNHADILKHLIVTRILKYLVKKDKPVCYIDTHAGAGGYSLVSAHALKTREFESGIGVLWKRNDLPAALTEYMALVREFNGSATLARYPGSPWFARQILRRNDRIFLYELHPTDYAQLRDHNAADRRVKVYHQEGFQGCIGLLPPLEKRGLVLIDPPYEIKDDYRQVIDTLKKAHQRFATGIYALWYPVIERNKINIMERSLLKSGIKKIQLFELGVQPDSSARGMTASGMIIINPPWTLLEEMQSLLPYLADMLALDGRGSYRIVELSEQ